MYEKSELNILEDGHKSFFEMTYSLMRKEGTRLLTGDAFQDLGEIFSGIHEPIYIDWMHIGEHGNWIIARRFADDIVPLLQTEVPARGTEVLH